MKYFIFSIAGILVAFLAYTFVSILIVHRLAKRIHAAEAQLPQLKSELRICQNKLLSAILQADGTCTIAHKLYVEGEPTLKSLEAVDKQIKHYFTRKPEIGKCEAVYQHYLSYKVRMEMLYGNRDSCSVMRRRFDGYRKDPLLGGFAEAAADKLPPVEKESTGILGFGLMRLPMLPDGEVDIAQCQEMADCMLQHGFTYFDTAYFYIDGKSERSVPKLLVERYPREYFKLADKMPVSLLKEEGDTERIFKEQLERTGAGYFDYYLLHALNNNTYEKQSKKFLVFEFVADKKAKGIVKQMGFSFHDKPEVLEKILTEHPEVDFVQLQLNYYDWNSKDVASARCYEIARAHGKQIVVMEPIKGGNLAVMPKEIKDANQALLENDSPATLALRFIAGQEGVMTVLSGMSTLEQAVENADSMARLQPLTKDKEEQLLQVAEELRKIPTYPCTRCRYCLEVCPKKLPIPKIIAQMNHRLRGGDDVIPEAKECIGCGACEKICPQKIAIRKVMEEGAKT